MGLPFGRLKKSMFRRRVLLGDQANQQRDWVLASKHYSAALNVNPSAWWISVQLGHSLKEQGRLEAAIKAYQQAQRNKPNEADPYLHLGHVSKMLRRFEQAITYYAAAAEFGAGTEVGFDALFELAELGFETDRQSVFQRVTNRAALCDCQLRSTPALDEVDAYRRRINASGLFDREWYTFAYRNHDIGGDPVQHFIEQGECLGLCPNPLFDPLYFKRINRHIAKGSRPFERFLRHWAEDQADPHPLFRLEPFAEILPELVSTGENPLGYFLKKSSVQVPYPLFDSAWYLARYPDVADAEINPLLHYVSSGYKEGRDPHPLFSAKWYAKHQPRTVTAQVNPLIHFELVGSKQGAEVHPLIDVAWYRDRYLRNDASVHPVIHYLERGWKDGCDPHPLFSTSWYLANNPEVANGCTNPLIHFLEYGWRTKRNPSPFFDLDWYTEHVSLRTDLNPLLHYLDLPDDTNVCGHPIVGAGRYKRADDSIGKPLIDYVRRNLEKRLSSTGEPLENSSAVSEEFAKSFQVALEADDALFGSVSTMRPYFGWIRSPQEIKEEVCVFAAYSPDHTIHESTKYYLKALKSQGISIVLVVARNSASSIDIAGLDYVDGIIVRDNAGYDFASWGLAMTALPALWDAKRVIFTNDSVFGPISEHSLMQVLDRLRNSNADVCYLTDSFQITYHGQSYFFVLQNEALKCDDVKVFWSGIKTLTNKDEIIFEYEIKAISRYEAMGLTTQILFPSPREDAKADVNPTLHNWRRLLKAGFPFLKVQLLRDTIAGVENLAWDASLEQNPELRKLIDKRLSSRSEIGRAASL